MSTLALAAVIRATPPPSAAGTGELARNTGQRVETGFWEVLEALLLSVPNLLGLVAMLAFGWICGRLLASVVRRRLERRDRLDLGRLLGAVTTWLCVLVAGLFALSFLFPSIRPANVLSGLGVGSIAVGFAFKDIFQNLAAGIILLAREPYRTGDEIIVGKGEIEGVVEKVETRATHIRTIDKRLVIVPNVNMFTHAITVNTNSSFRMSSITVSVAYGGDPHHAANVVLAAVRGAEGVHEAPSASVTVSALNDFAIDLHIVFPAAPTEVEQIKTKGAVLIAIYAACRANEIELPFPTQVNLLRFQEGYEPNKLMGTSSSDRSDER